jgi:NTE family protein
MPDNTTSADNPPPQNAALVLLGGGARTAYQAGVLGGVGEILQAQGWPAQRNPFPVVCGTSAGAINAAYFASRCADWPTALHELQTLWSTLQAHEVFEVGTGQLLRGGARWLGLMVFGWLWKQNPRALLDNTPLADTLGRRVHFDAVDAAIQSGALRALSVATSSYTSGRHITFFQARPEVQPWRRPGLWGIAQPIGVEHLLASSALPFVFPATPLYGEVGPEYFGDGAMRQLAPLAPAIHLGAERALAIGVAEPHPEAGQMRRHLPPYPSVAEIAAHAMSSVFLDTLRADAQQAGRINRMLSDLPSEVRADLPYRALPTLTLLPSTSIDAIAARHWHSMPRGARLLLQSVGMGTGRGSALASYLLFTPDYLSALVELGRADALAQRDAITAFFNPTAPDPHCA